MLTTIDSAGRLVVPKALREAMGLLPGQTVDISFSDGRLEIEIPPVAAVLADRDGLPVMTTDADQPPLDPETVRRTIEATRR